MGEALAEARLARRAWRAAQRRRRGRRRGDGRAGARPRPGDQRPDRPRRRRRAARGRPQARRAPASPTRRSSRPRALRDVRRRAPRERRRGARLRRPERAATAPPARSSSSPSTRRCRAGSRSSAASAATRPRRSSRHSPLAERRGRVAGTAGRPRAVWYPLPRRGVRVVDGAALEKRCAKAPRVRIPPSPPRSIGLIDPGRVGACAPRSRTSQCARSGARLPPCQGPPYATSVAQPASCDATIRTLTTPPADYRSASRRGRLVDYGAALEMRFGATRRGFESRPLRHTLVRRRDGRAARSETAPRRHGHYGCAATSRVLGALGVARDRLRPLGSDVHAALCRPTPVSLVVGELRIAATSAAGRAPARGRLRGPASRGVSLADTGLGSPTASPAPTSRPRPRRVPRPHPWPTCSRRELAAAPSRTPHRPVERHSNAPHLRPSGRAATTSTRRDPRRSTPGHSPATSPRRRRPEVGRPGRSGRLRASTSATDARRIERDGRRLRQPVVDASVDPDSRAAPTSAARRPTIRRRWARA